MRRVVYKGNLVLCTLTYGVDRLCSGNCSVCVYLSHTRPSTDPVHPLVATVNPHEQGAKLDTGKPRVGLVLGGFARALLEVSKVGTFGANKYSDNGWMQVDNGVNRYHDAKNRHDLEGSITLLDPESGYLHAAHEAWNALAKLDLMLREQEVSIGK